MKPDRATSHFCRVSNIEGLSWKLNEKLPVKAPCFYRVVCSLAREVVAVFTRKGKRLL